MSFASALRAIVCASACLLASVSIAQDSIEKTPHWIWAGKSKDDASVALRTVFELKSGIKQAVLIGTADNKCQIAVNGKNAIKGTAWEQLNTADVTSSVKPGKNVIAINATNEGGIAGALAYMVVRYEDGSRTEVATDDSWKGAEKPSEGWRQADFNDSAWSKVEVLGKIGGQGLAWSQAVNLTALQEAARGGDAGEYVPHVAENAKVPEGFKIEKIYNVPRSMGSWVSITVDPKGRLVACDQGGAGLYLITPGVNGQPTKVQKMPVSLSGAQGLLYAFDALYAVVNGGPGSGLHRLTDTDGDGLADKDEHLMHIDGGGEHGPHAVVLSPDGKSLYVCAGNHTKLPKIVDSKTPQNWQEDHLLPRRWDANGHAAGILAPGGWICNVDPNGKNWSVYSMGYRNEYDIAFNADGELFSYDADMEWDFGSPWYRPTRVVHASSGSEFGWRSGTGKWPEYYEDSLPPAMNIGPGSPVGILFGYGAKFPAKYQKRLFILDWTYSTIYSVELSPNGSTYKGKFEDFVTGSPLPMTDAIVGKDGAFYFAVGGRGTQSAVYRVTYVGSESTAPVDATNKLGAEDRAIRHSLERFHGTEASQKVSEADMKLILKHLGSEDRFIRFAARTALEFQPTSKWREQALKIGEPRAAISAMAALARQGDAKDLDAIATKLISLPHQDLDEQSKLAALRTMQVALARRAESGTTLSPQVRERVLNLLEAVYPTGSYPIDAEMVQLLVKLDSPVVVERTLAMMKEFGPEPIPEWGFLVARNESYGGTIGKMLENMPPVRGIHFAFVLRNAKTPWTLDQRKQYFNFLIEASKKPGGNSFAKFLDQFRDDAIANCSAAEKVVLDDLINRSLAAPAFESTPPKGPGRKWTTADAVAELGEKLSKRNHAAGRNLFHATTCSKCHRLAGEGGAIGPDLSTAGKKFSLTDLMDAIVEPSKAISDQYGSHQVLTSSGTVLIGRVVEIGDQVHVYTADANAKPVVLKKSEVDEMTPSKVSQMPTGLVDNLSTEELKDLVAYIIAAGDQRNAVYK
ncbi:MAG: c-type cytochrome [Pirellulales bacterium]